MLERAARRDLAPRAAARLGGLLIRPAARGLRARLDPETYGGGYLLGLRGLVVIAHGSSSRVAIANAIRMAARGVEHRHRRALATRLPQQPRRADAALAGRVGALFRPRTTTSEVQKWHFPAMKSSSASRSALVEQLGVDEGEITDEASFQDDLDADSLDLVELIMELEDQFGVKIPDEDAQKLTTVGQAVDYVVEHQ